MLRWKSFSGLSDQTLLITGDGDGEIIGMIRQVFGQTEVCTWNGNWIAVDGDLAAAKHKLVSLLGRMINLSLSPAQKELMKLLK